MNFRWASLVPLAFVAVAAAWAFAKIDGAETAAVPPVGTPAPLSAGVASDPDYSSLITPTTSASPSGAAPTEAAPANDAPPATATIPAASPVPPGGAAATPASTPTPANTGDQAAAEIAATNTLHQLGKAYLQALISNDPATIAGMLASRCSGSDPAAILARRRAEVAAEAGVPVETLVAIAPVVAHLDIPGHEAHTVIQFDAGGVRHTLGSADGWVLEGGAWRNGEC